MRSAHAIFVAWLDTVLEACPRRLSTAFLFGAKSECCLFSWQSQAWGTCLVMTKMTIFSALPRPNLWYQPFLCNGDVKEETNVIYQSKENAQRVVVPGLKRVAAKHADGIIHLGSECQFVWLPMLHFFTNIKRVTELSPLTALLTCLIFWKPIAFTLVTLFVSFGYRPLILSSNPCTFFSCCPTEFCFLS